MQRKTTGVLCEKSYRFLAPRVHPRQTCGSQTKKQCLASVRPKVSLFGADSDGSVNFTQRAGVEQGKRIREISTWSTRHGPGESH